MKKTISFGKVDYNNSGRKNCEVCVEVELRVLDNGLDELSICGEIWNPRHTDIYCGGQCLDTLKEYVGDDSLFMELYSLWKQYHLNGLNAGTHRQKASIDDYFKKIGKPYDYGLAVEHLKNVGLYVDKLADGEFLNCETETANRESYTYGHGWIVYAIPNDVLGRIKEIIG